MDLKTRLKKAFTDFTDSGSKISPEDELTTSNLLQGSFNKSVTSTQFVNDPYADRQAIDSIESIYYNDPNSFNAGEYEIANFFKENSIFSDDNSLHIKPAIIERLDHNLDRLKKQAMAVSRKVSELVLENHRAYESELERVIELQVVYLQLGDLSSAANVCKESRKELALAKNKFTGTSLMLLANHNRKKRLTKVLQSLFTIKTLQRTDVRVRQLLESEDYPGAIQLCLECLKAASTFKYFNCISELNTKLSETLVTMEEALDKALSKCCIIFDDVHYNKIQAAFSLLGKSQAALDQLQMHFTSAIHNTAFVKVLGYAQLNHEIDDTLRRKQYNELCCCVSNDLFTPCLVDICKSLWQIMCNYYRVCIWHESNELSDNNEINDAQKRYVRRKLNHGKIRVWDDVQQRIKLYISANDLSFFHYDQFIYILDIINRLIKIGEEFCSSKSDSLKDSIKIQSVNYFKHYHRNRLDDLRMFLENETWQICPLKPGFNIFQLHEFKSFCEQPNFKIAHESSSSNSLNVNAKQSPIHSPKSSSRQNSTEKITMNSDYFEKYMENDTSPFEMVNDEKIDEDVLDEVNFTNTIMNTNNKYDSDTDSEIEDEALKQDFVDEKTGDNKMYTSLKHHSHTKIRRKSGKNIPIITNTTLSVCRLFGKYMQMMTVLTPIAFDVTICLSQLFDFYLYAIYSFFCINDQEISVPSETSNGMNLSTKLISTLRRIGENLIATQITEEESIENLKNKISCPKLSSSVDMKNTESLFALTERIVATESLVFLAEQTELLQKYLERLISPNKRAFLLQFYSQTVSTAKEFRIPVYKNVAYQVINYDAVGMLMAPVRYDLKEITSEHSQYINIILQELNQFKNRMESINKRVPIPIIVYEILWENVLKLINKCLLDGFSSVKKCTNEGRALMQLDYHQFLIKLEKLTDLRPIPYRELVELFIKAYYLPEVQLEEWIRNHKEYSVKQSIALVNQIPHLNKKFRQRLINILEESNRK